MKHSMQVYSEPCQSSTMKHFVKIVNGWKVYDLYLNLWFILTGKNVLASNIDLSEGGEE